jgi:hypothetical protein
MDLTTTLIEKLFNPALDRISAKSLTGVSDTSNEADKCKANYESVRNSELRERIWGSTKKRALLTVDGASPIGDEWDYRYAEPTDSIYIINIQDDDLFTVESGYILSNTKDKNDQILVKYVQAADISSGSALDAEILRFDAGLLNVMIARMAATLALTISKKRSSREDAWILYERALNSAKLANAYEDRNERDERTEQESDWIISRGRR